MPTAPIDSKGNYVYYEDSGAPDGVQDYVTVFIVHGALINSATFRKMLPLASKHGLRILTMNMRDYRDSSPYTAEEMAAMASPDVEDQAFAIRLLGRDIASFITWVCKTKEVPNIRHDGERKTGGVVLMTWSRSNMGLLSILGDPETLDGENQITIPQYLRKVVLYDCTSGIFGVYPELGLHYPIRSAEIPMPQKPAAFAQWVSSYYEPIPEGVPITADALRGRALLAHLAPTLAKLTPEEYERTFDPTVFDRSGRLVSIAMTDDIYQRNFRRAFLDADAVLPGVDAVALWCDQSVWVSVWGVKVLEDLLRDEPAVSRKRPVTIMRINGANHFLHWDEPDRMLRVLRDII